MRLPDRIPQQLLIKLALCREGRLCNFSSVNIICLIKIQNN